MTGHLPSGWAPAALIAAAFAAVGMGLVVAVRPVHPGRVALLAPLKMAAFWGLHRELLYEYREGYFGRRPWLRWPLAVGGLGLAPLAALAVFPGPPLADGAVQRVRRGRNTSPSLRSLAAPHGYRLVRGHVTAKEYPKWSRARPASP